MWTTHASTPEMADAWQLCICKGVLTPARVHAKDVCRDMICWHTLRSSSRVSSDRLVTRTEFSSRRRMLSPSEAPPRLLGGT